MLNIESYDERRDYIVAEKAVLFAAEHWIHSAKRSIQQRGRFAVALSGGSTPKAIFKMLSQSRDIEWDKVWLFWSDERAVPATHPESNYHMAMESGLKNLPIPPHQIFRMKAEGDIEKNALDYEEIIRRRLDKSLFDLVMLGVGEDGHTASLFPNTKALEIKENLVAANFIPSLKAHRMTLTFPCINESHQAAIYIGKSKASIVPKVLDAAILSPYPASHIGTVERKALWILDKEAGHFV